MRQLPCRGTHCLDFLNVLWYNQVTEYWEIRKNSVKILNQRFGAASDRDRRMVMTVVIIVNIVWSLGIILGGFCMKQYSRSTKERSVGFKTKRAMSSQDAWYFANQKCGGLWIAGGLAGLILTIAAIFIFRNEKTEGIVQAAVLVLLTAATFVSAIVTEKLLKRKYDNSNRS